MNGNLFSTKKDKMAKSNTSPAQVQKELKGVDYPASKQDLLDLVGNSGNKKEVRDLLDQIPDKEYNSPVDVSKEIGKIE